MANLRDIVRKRITVEIGGNGVEVTGLSGNAIGHLLDRPELSQISEKLTEGEDVVFSLGTLFDLGVPAVAAIIAAGTGNEGDEEVERMVAEDLTFGEQWELLEAVASATFPKGMDDFLSKLGRLKKLKGVKKAG